MHPLLTPIHPALRTALSAWMVSRALSWLIMYGRGVWPWALLTEQDARGGAGWSLWTHALLWLDARWGFIAGQPPSAWAMTVAAELAILAGLVSVYQLSRRDALPQVAERATWLWALSPLMALLLPGQAWTIAVGLALVSLACAERARYGAALLCAAIAVSFKLDVALIAPMLAWLGYKAYAPGRAHPLAPWVLGVGGVALWPLSIFGAMWLGGMGGVSLRTLHPEPFALHGLASLNGALMLKIGAVAIALGALFKVRREQPWPVLAMSLPMLAWPLLFEHRGELFGVWGLCAAVFVGLSRMAEDPAWERPLLGALIVGQLAMALLH